MPQASPTAKKADPVVIRVDVDAQSQVSWNGKPAGSRAELDQKVRQAAAMDPQPEIHIRSHPKAKYEAVVAVMVSAQSQGLTKLGILGSEQFAN
jgi:biopolymer transport protein ExbD